MRNGFSSCKLRMSTIRSTACAIWALVIGIKLYHSSNLQRVAQMPCTSFADADKLYPMDIALSLLIKLIPLYCVILLGFLAGRYLHAQKETIGSLLIYIIAPFVIF